MTLKLNHVDELYLLQEAVALIAATIDPSREWRAAAAAQALADRLAQMAEKEASA